MTTTTKPIRVRWQIEHVGGGKSTGPETAQDRVRIDISAVWPRQASARIYPAHPVQPVKHPPQDRRLLQRLPCVLAAQRKRTTQAFITMTATLQSLQFGWARIASIIRTTRLRVAAGLESVAGVSVIGPGVQPRRQ
jgi:hypothetical protein